MAGTSRLVARSVTRSRMAGTSRLAARSVKRSGVAGTSGRWPVL